MVWWKPEIKDEPSPWKDAAVPATNAWAQKAQTRKIVDNLLGKTTSEKPKPASRKASSEMDLDKPLPALPVDTSIPSPEVTRNEGVVLSHGDTASPTKSGVIATRFQPKLAYGYESHHSMAASIVDPNAVCYPEPKGTRAEQMLVARADKTNRQYNLTIKGSRSMDDIKKAAMRTFCTNFAAEKYIDYSPVEEGYGELVAGLMARDKYLESRCARLENAVGMSRLDFP